MAAKSPSQMADILLASVIEELRSRDTLEGLCMEAFYPGQNVPADFGLESCGGMVWVQMSAANPTVTFPDPDYAVGNCSYSLAYTFEVGLIRPTPVPTEERGHITLPGAEEISAAAYQQMDDLEAMHRGISDCKKYIDYVILGSYAPIGPDGGAGGGAWTVMMGNEDAD